MRDSALAIILGAAVSLSAGASQAACTNGTTALSLAKNGPAKHVTVVDQNCTPVAVGQVTLGVGGLGQCSAAAVNLASAMPPPNRLAVTADATGLGFQAVVGAPAMAACNVTLTYTDGSVKRSSNLAVDIPSDVTAVSLTSP